MFFKHILFYFSILCLFGCDAIDNIKSKIVKNEKHKLFVVASKQEIDINKFEIKKALYTDAYLTDVGYILYSGVGKINTTYSLTKFLTLYKDNISEIYNIGTAGATENNKFADMVECNKFIQNDAEDFLKKREIVKKNTFLKENNDYTCLTTDSFITSQQANGKLMFEMEAYANAKVADNFGILDKFYAIKFVSDIVGNNNLEHWDKDADALNNKLVNKIKEIANEK